MQVTKNMVFADRDKRRKGREVKVVRVEDGYATVEVITDSERAVKSSIGKSTDIRVDRLEKEYDLVASLFTPGPTDYVDLNEDLDNIYADSVTDSDDDIIEDEHDLEDALRTAGYHWLAPVEDLITIVEENVYSDTSPEVVVRVMHQIIKERLVG